MPLSLSIISAPHFAEDKLRLREIKSLAQINQSMNQFEPKVLLTLDGALLHRPSFSHHPQPSVFSSLPLNACSALCPLPQEYGCDLQHRQTALTTEGLHPELCGPESDEQLIPYCLKVQRMPSGCPGRIPGLGSLLPGCLLAT